MDKVTRQSAQTTTVLRGKENRSGIEPGSFRLPAYRLTARPNRLTGERGLLSCCLTSTEAKWPIRDGDRVGRGRESERLDRGNRPKKTGETVDRRQNNGSVKAVSPRHCPATCALRNCCFNCCAGQNHYDNVRCTAVDEQLGQLEAKDVQLAQPSATSLLMISSGQS